MEEPMVLERDDLLSKIVRYGLYFGAIFQIVCIGSAVFLFPESRNNESIDFESASEMEISPQLTPKRQHHRSKRTEKKKRR